MAFVYFWIGKLLDVGKEFSQEKRGVVGSSAEKDVFVLNYPLLYFEFILSCSLEVELFNLGSEFGPQGKKLLAVLVKPLVWILIRLLHKFEK